MGIKGPHGSIPAYSQAKTCEGSIHILDNSKAILLNNTWRPLSDSAYAAMGSWWNGNPNDNCMPNDSGSVTGDYTDTSVGPPVPGLPEGVLLGDVALLRYDDQCLNTVACNSGPAGSQCLAWTAESDGKGYCPMLEPQTFTAYLAGVWGQMHERLFRMHE